MLHNTMSFAALEGDRRQSILCQLLQADGHRAQLLPEPARWKGENLPPPGTVLITAQAGPELCARANELGFRVAEYGREPAFLEENGRITAENALCFAMTRRMRTIRGCDALVVGWGNIGKPLAALLRAVGAGSVAVAARREESLRDAKAQGFTAFDSKELAGRVGDFDLIFNTAPEPVFPQEVLEEVGPQALLIDLASKPGGVDWEAAQDLGVRAIPALGLPGKMTPVSAAAAIRNIVYALCREVHG